MLGIRGGHPRNSRGSQPAACPEMLNLARGQTPAGLLSVVNARNRARGAVSGQALPIFRFQTRLELSKPNPGPWLGRLCG
jgi:hypothetical protein